MEDSDSAYSAPVSLVPSRRASIVKVDIPQPPPPKKLSRKRKGWLCFVWGVTFPIPFFCLSCCGMKRKDQQIAWYFLYLYRREKVALCVIIFLLNAFILFFIVGLGWILCPPKHQLSPGEIQSRNSLSNKPYVQMYGYYYDVSSLANTHIAKGYVKQLVLEQTTFGQGLDDVT